MLLTLDSTFQDIRDLLENGDEYFNQIIRNVSKRDDEKKNYKFYFFMALALGGVDDNSSYQEKFLNLVGIKKDEWSIMTRDFVQIEKAASTKKTGLDSKYNKKLTNLNPNISLRILYNKDTMELEDSEGNNIFSSSDNWCFESYSNDDGPIRAKKEINQVIEDLIDECNIKITSQYKLLLANKQLIMHGAPGTGETFSAIYELADRLLNISYKTEEEKKEIKKIQVDMVQFHPSYDYTDFIDGIRPDLSSKGLKYMLKNGSFKSFCRRAGVIERIYEADKSVDTKTIDEFLDGEDDSIRNFWKNKIKKDELKKEIEYANQKVNKKQAKKVDTITFDTSKLPKFLFIIDEINRAEISKVLGETMYCLDPDYRGQKGAISTQYSALATKETLFISEDNDKFFIPSNVYIIGTMNDIDRSVEVFDFALRRRFAWYEVKAEEVKDIILTSMEIDRVFASDYEDYKERIKALNKSITNDLKLTEHYHLGPAYFAKIKFYFSKDNPNYKEAREKVWNNHLSQILDEYVKGKGRHVEIENIKNSFIL